MLGSSFDMLKHAWLDADPQTSNMDTVSDYSKTKSNTPATEHPVGVITVCYSKSFRDAPQEVLGI